MALYKCIVDQSIGVSDTLEMCCLTVLYGYVCAHLSIVL